MFKAIAFDLDDTLIDTSNLLVPEASRLACQSLLDKGLKSDLATLQKMRTELIAEYSHQEIFKLMCDKFKAPTEWAEEAVSLFYSPHIPSDIPLMPGAVENLNQLKSKYALFLVTSGIPDVQKQKTSAAKLDQYVDGSYWVDGFLGDTKLKAFNDIIANLKIQPHELLVIGNRITNEIREGKQAGAQTCFFAHGEHLAEKPQVPEDHPDWTIHRHQDLIKVCQL